jgi:hypothetical protein
MPASGSLKLIPHPRPPPPRQQWVDRAKERYTYDELRLAGVLIHTASKAGLFGSEKSRVLLERRTTRTEWKFWRKSLRRKGEEDEDEEVGRKKRKGEGKDRVERDIEYL